MRGEFELMSSTGSTLWSGNSKRVCLELARTTPGATPGRWSFGTFVPMPLAAITDDDVEDARDACQRALHDAIARKVITVTPDPNA